jgi:hypothetical protein
MHVYMYVLGLPGHYCPTSPPEVPECLVGAQLAKNLACILIKVGIEATLDVGQTHMSNYHLSD